MKAGRAGSTPDGVTSLSDPVSAALVEFLEGIGAAVFSLNTIVVGLAAVESGYEKPEGLDISWNPEDRQIAARKTRRFAVEAVLVRVSEELNQYIVAISKLPRFNDVRARWAGQKQQPSVADKLSTIATSILGDGEYLIPASILLVHWRNRIVHESSEAKLQAHEKSLLRGSDEEIAKRYKELSVDCLLCHFQRQRPTLKDVSSLTAMAINLARKMDAAVCECFSKDDLDTWLAYYGIASAIEKVRAETAPEKVEAAIARVFSSRAPHLLEVYRKFSSPPVSH
jgi:hypothetical protein